VAGDDDEVDHRCSHGEERKHGPKHGLDAALSRGLRRASRRRLGLARGSELVPGAGAAAGEKEAERNEPGARRRDEDALRDLERSAPHVRFFLLGVLLFLFGCLVLLLRVLGLLLLDMAVRGVRVAVENGCRGHEGAK
jgi:hypothetical protein